MSLKDEIAMATIGLMFVFEAALLNMPDLVSSEIDEYMKDHDAPLELIEGVRTDGVRVYNERSFLAAAHMLAFAVWNNYKNFDPVGALKDCASGGAAMFGRSGRIVMAHGKAMIYMPDSDYLVDEQISDITGIPVKDLELNEDVIRLLLAYILLHEIGHGQPLDVIKQQYCSDGELFRKLRKGDNLEDIKNITALYTELKSDEFASGIIDLKSIYDFVIGFRAIESFGRVDDVSHDTSVYLDEILNGKNESIRDRIPNHLEEKKELMRMINPFIMLNSNEEISTYRHYLAALHFLESFEGSDEISDFSRKAVELFVQGVEHIAPTKSQQLRRQHENNVAFETDMFTPMS